MHEDFDLCRVSAVEVQISRAFNDCSQKMASHHSHDYSTSLQYLLLARMSASIDTCYNGHHEAYKLKPVPVELIQDRWESWSAQQALRFTA